MTPDYLNDLHYIWPEVVMTVAILLALFSDLILGGKDQKVTGTISVLCTCLVIYFLARLWIEGNVQRPFHPRLIAGGHEPGVETCRNTRQGLHDALNVHHHAVHHARPDGQLLVHEAAGHWDPSPI